MLYLAVSGLFSHWRRHPSQLATLVIGLALATALWSGVQAINAEARNAYDRAEATLGQDTLSRLVEPSGGPVSLSDYVKLRRQGYSVSPVITGILREGDLRLRILGIDPMTTPAQATPPALAGTVNADLDDFFGEPGVLLLGDGSEIADLPGGFPTAELSEDVPPGAAITDIATAARLLGQTDPSYLLIAPDQPVTLPTLPAESGLQVEAPGSGTDIAQLTDSFHLNLTAFGLLAFAVGLFIVYGAVSLATEQRRATVRTMRALGVPMRSVLVAFTAELAVLALISALIGLVLGYVIAAALMPGVAGTLRGLYGAEVAGSLRFDPAWALAGGAMTLAGAGLAGVSAFAKIARLPLLAPANPRAWAVVSAQGMRLQGIAAAGIFILAAAFAVFGDGLAFGFGFLALLLIGAALMLPGLLLLGLKLIERFKHPSASLRFDWLLADARQQIPSLSMALMALLLALAANIGVSTMVGSFRITFLGWLDQRLASELYITTSDAAEATALLRFIDGRVDAALPIVSSDATLFDRPAEIYGIIDHATYRDHWPLLQSAPDTWDVIANGDGVLINEQLSYRADLRVGDLIPLPGNRTLPVSGIYSDYGNTSGQVIIGYGLFESLFPDVVPVRYALRVPEGQVAALAATLREDFGLPVEAVINQEQVKRFSLTVFDRTFQITGALNILTLAVAGFAIWTSLATLAGMRLPQLAPVWAIGLTRAELARFEVYRAILLAVLTFLLAIPVGLILAWGLLAVVNVEAFGWRLPMQIFPGDWLWLAALAILAAVLAAAIPALRLARISPDQLLRVFANDR